MKKYLILFLLLVPGLSANPENACLFMRTGDGVGTGFIVKHGEAFRLISNQHVISGSTPHSYEKLDGSKIRPLTGLVSNDRDIVIFTIEGLQEDYLEMEPDLNDVALGEEVVIYGNARGQGMRVSEATIVSKGPKTIEISGGIVPGNSGGPIIRKKTGKVIAVSTFLLIQPSHPQTVNEVIDAVTLPKIRSYGVRIDTAKSFTPFDLRDFISDYNAIKQAERRLRDALIISVLLLKKHGSASITQGMSDLISEASDKHHFAMTNLRYSLMYPGTYSKSTISAFRSNTETFFTEPAKPRFFIHQDRYEKIIVYQRYLKELYADILKALPVR